MALEAGQHGGAPPQPHPSEQGGNSPRPRPSTSLTGQVTGGSVCPAHCSVALGFWLLPAVRSEAETALGLEEGPRGSPAQPVPKYRTQDEHPHHHPVAPRTRPVFRVQSGVKEEDGSVSAPGALRGTGRTLAPCPGEPEGSRPTSCPFSVTADTWTWRAGQSSSSSFPAPSTHRGRGDGVWGPC